MCVCVCAVVIIGHWVPLQGLCVCGVGVVVINRSLGTTAGTVVVIIDHWVPLQGLCVWGQVVVRPTVAVINMWPANTGPNTCYGDFGAY